MITRGGTAETFAVALRLGLTSFGGPIAHIGYFRREYVARRQWLDERAFGELVALAQTLPGPASSQLGFAIGTLRAGIRGGLAAWLGFTLPSAIALIAFALVTDSVDLGRAPWVHGLRLAAVAVVAQAVWQMRRNLAPDIPRRGIALAALVTALAGPPGIAPIATIAGGALLGSFVLRPQPTDSDAPMAVPVSRRAGLVALLLFVSLLVGLPALRAAGAPQPMAFADAFYRSGALVFGGGHVILPLLHDAVVVPGWVAEDRFLAGYGAAQAVPGPLSTFAGYLGAVTTTTPNGISGALLALLAIFLPGLLLMLAAMPFWVELRRSPTLQRALAGVGAAVVGILAAALYDPVWRTAVASPVDVAIALVGLAALAVMRAPPIAVVVASALAAQVVG